MSRSLVVLLSSLLPLHAYAWDAEVHYAWTWYVAVQVGFTERQAHQIASAAQAVSDDADTRIDATSWEQVSDAPIDEVVETPQRKALRDFHCFSPWTPGPPRDALSALGWVPVTGTDSDRVGRSFEGDLWRKAVATGNPGPVVHYVQDCVVHRDFDDRAGHAAAGHFPDWMATDSERAREMTFQTARVLVRWQKEVLALSPPAVDKERLFAVMAQIAEANPVDRSGEIAATGPENPMKWLAAGLTGISAANAFDRRWELDREGAKKFDIGHPSVDEAIIVLGKATHEDKVLGTLPAFADERWEAPLLSWLSYDIDAELTPSTDGPAWALEQVGLELPGEAAFARVEPPAAGATDRLYKIVLRRPYRLVGVADLPPYGGVPVRESCTVSDTREKVVWTTFRGNGEHAITATLYRPAEALAQELTWTCSVSVHGVRSEEQILRVPPLSATVIAAETAAVADAGPVATHVEQLATLRAEAIGLAARVASACEAAGEVRRQADLDVASVIDRLGRYEAQLKAAATRCEAVPGSLDAAATHLAGAEGGAYAVRGKQSTFEKASAATCEAFTAHKRAPTAATLASVETAEESTKAARREVDAAVATVVGGVDAIAALRDDMADLAREGRRLQDAVWSIDPVLTGIEASIDGARGSLAGRKADATRLAELATQAATVASEGDAAFKAGGKPGKSKPAVAAMATMRDQIAALGARSACVASQTTALEASGEAIHGLLGRSGSLAADRALLDKALPTDELQYALDSLHLKAGVLADDMAARKPALIMTSDRSATCLGDARAIRP